MDISRLKGQEHIKRALEVAAMGNHSVTLTAISCYDDASNFVYPIARNLGIQEFHIVEPCQCGNFGSAELECTCNSPMKLPAFARSVDMFLDMYIPTYEKLTSTRQGETTEDVLARISAAKKHKQPTNDLDSAAQSLMKAAVRQLAMTQTVMERTINVARTIAWLAGSKNIGPAHLAEAVQYRPQRK